MAAAVDALLEVAERVDENNYYLPRESVAAKQNKLVSACTASLST
jgi:hypothetical protein